MERRTIAKTSTARGGQLHTRTPLRDNFFERLELATANEHRALSLPYICLGPLRPSAQKEDEGIEEQLGWFGFFFSADQVLNARPALHAQGHACYNGVSSDDDSE